MSRSNASDVWSLMIKTAPGLATCSICKNTFKYPGGSTTNLRRHLNTKHHVWSLKATDSVKESTGKPSFDKPPTRATSTPTLQSTLSGVRKYDRESEKKKSLDDLVTKMIVKDLQPVTVVEDDGFKALVEGLDPQYQLPSWTTIAEKLLPVKYENEKDKLRTVLENVDHVAITTDLWTSHRTESYITVTAHYLNLSWQRQSAVLATRLITSPHTAENTGTVLKGVFREWGIESKISSLVTGNASMMVSLAGDHVQTHHVRCFAQTLNLIVCEAIENNEDIMPLIKKVKAIVTLFHHSSKASEKLKNMQTSLGRKEKHLVQDVETRWNSTLKMLERYVEEQQPVAGALCAIGKAEMVLSDDEVSIVKKAIDVLTRFDISTQEMSADKYPSLSKTLPTVRQIQEILSKEDATPLRDHLLSEMQKQFADLQENKTLSAATFLDPRFKQLPFADQASLDRLGDQLTSLMNEGLEPEESASCSSCQTSDEHEPPTKKSLWASFDERVEALSKNAIPALSGPAIELRKYHDMGFLKRLQDPLQWWKENQSIFPQLSLLARQFLHIPATSVPSERLFSKAGELISARRSCLKATDVDMILFLNKKLE